jgi:G3E family GTPase
VITAVDALLGMATLDHHEESRRQVAVADRIVITKTDLDGAQPEAIRQRLAAANPGAPCIAAVRGAIAPSVLFDCGFYDVAGKHPDVGAWLAHESVDGAAGPAYRPHPSHQHTDAITSFCIVREEPLRAVTLPLLLSALAENCGADLLRMKGIVNVLEMPERPAVIHGVQHVYHAPVWLPHWPSADHRTRMVFIGRNIRESWVRTLIELLDAEVHAEIARHGLMAQPAAIAG